MSEYSEKNKELLRRFKKDLAKCKTVKCSKKMFKTAFNKFLSVNELFKNKIIQSKIVDMFAEKLYPAHK